MGLLYLMPKAFRANANHKTTTTAADIPPLQTEFNNINSNNNNSYIHVPPILSAFNCRIINFKVRKTNKNKFSQFVTKFSAYVAVFCVVCLVALFVCCMCFVHSAAIFLQKGEMEVSGCLLFFFLRGVYIFF